MIIGALVLIAILMFAMTGSAQAKETLQT